ncbi:MAG TPA: TIGR02679 family protein [Mycobacterium sp.]|nr:TIGR02679 family protein [Mycobacterium sp.]
MTELPEELREYLSAPSLQAVWRSLRERLQRRGLQLIGSISIPLDDERADRLGGLLGRNLASGRTVQISLLDLDTALRRSAAQRGLAAVVADLTGAPLRDRIGERETARAELNRLWAELDVALVDAGLASEDWVVPWTDWLRRGGVITRLPPPVALDSLRPSVWILNDLLNRTSGTDNLATLATLFTGSAHGLDDGTPTAALVLRGLAQALDVPAPSTPSERRALWHRVGIATDEISGTVLVWALRPPGTDRWSAMMRERADLGLITHLTTHELQRAPELTTPGGLVHACENPQVLQQLAAAGVDRPVICTSGNPSTAGAMLVDRVKLRYHGDFDWPGIAIARRMTDRGATTWRLGHTDYLQAVDRLPTNNRLPLTGRVEPTPWDDELRASMTATDVAVHEEAVIDILLGDLLSS